MTNVHGHRPDSTSNVDIVEVHEDLVQIMVLTGPPGAPGRGRLRVRGEVDCVSGAHTYRRGAMARRDGRGVYRMTMTYVPLCDRAFATDAPPPAAVVGR